jgi:hypothetical protein
MFSSNSYYLCIVRKKSSIFRRDSKASLSHYETIYI